MSKGTIQYFNISKLASKVSPKVFEIESEYDDMVIPDVFKKCSRCKKEKHMDYYGINQYTGISRKCCNQCNEYNKQYKLNNK